MTRILIFTENFYPAYKAGGPVQSITNLILALENQYTFQVITSAFDLNDEAVLQNIEINKWNRITLPGSTKSISVWYAAEFSIKTCNTIFKTIKFEKIYLNGIFSYPFFLVPVLVSAFFRLKPLLVICPRGMLQKGAIAGKFLKKRIYLKALRVSGLLSKAKWHATNTEEKNDIEKYFVATDRISVAANIPKRPVHNIIIPARVMADFNLVYLSLITQKKNLFFLLNIFKQVNINITLDIYGPVKDMDYWHECEKLIAQLPGRVKYCGDVLPAKVQQIFEKYHASILLTRGENFGHALYESLSVGRPVITSYYTPWNDLESLRAGWNVDILNEQNCINLLNSLILLTEADYSQYCKGAYDLATNYFEQSSNLQNYKNLFSEL